MIGEKYTVIRDSLLIGESGNPVAAGQTILVDIQGKPYACLVLAVTHNKANQDRGESFAYEVQVGEHIA